MMDSVFTDDVPRDKLGRRIGARAGRKLQFRPRKQFLGTREERYQIIQDLYPKGATLAEIEEKTGYSPKTISKLASMMNLRRSGK